MVRSYGKLAPRRQGFRPQPMGQYLACTFLLLHLRPSPSPRSQPAAEGACTEDRETSDTKVTLIVQADQVKIAGGRTVEAHRLPLRAGSLRVRRSPQRREM